MNKQTFKQRSEITGDIIHERRTCPISGKEFAIFQSDISFYKKIDPSNYQYLSPALHPHERQRKRLARRNERTLYKRACDASGKMIISAYDPSSPYTVYERDIRFGDSRDAKEYGRDFDFTRPFFEQFDELLKSVPHISLFMTTQENSTYCNGASNMKDCYLCFNCDYLENCLYVSSSTFSENSIDCLLLHHSQYCYQCINLTKCYNCLYLRNSESCTNCEYSSDCHGCSDCFLCTDLQNKQYHILNELYTKDAYEKKKKELKEKGHDYLAAIAESCYRKRETRSNYCYRNQNAMGNYLNESQNSFACYESSTLKDCKYCYYMHHNCEECMDCDIYGDESKILYQCAMTWWQCYHNSFCRSVRNSSSYNNYCSLMVASNNNFGSASLKHSSYCIFNKQYTKQEYQTKKQKIIEHMKETGEYGKFFPLSLSPFAYNHTFAQEFYPLQRSEKDAYDAKRSDERQSINIPPNAKTLSAADLRDISPEDYLSLYGSVILCEISGRPYRLTKAELEFYQKQKIELPTKHPDIRHKERSVYRLPMDVS